MSDVKNYEIAELLAGAAERTKPPLQRAFRRAARRAFLWPERQKKSTHAAKALPCSPVWDPI
jgi:hypothetical protein